MMKPDLMKQLTEIPRTDFNRSLINIDFTVATS